MVWSPVPVARLMLLANCGWLGRGAVCRLALLPVLSTADWITGFFNPIEK